MAVRKRKNAYSPINIFYIALVLICVAVSTWSSFHGFFTTLKALAWPVAAGIGICLFASDISIKEKLDRNDRIRGPLLLFSIALIFSAMSNFNYFYSNFMTANVAQSAYSDAYHRFEDNMDVAAGALVSDPLYADVARDRAYVEQELINLRSEATDPNNPGIGPKARGHMTNIEARLGSPINQLALPPNRLDAVLQFLDLYEQNVTRAMNRDHEAVLASFDPILRGIAKDVERFKDISEDIAAGRADFNAGQKIRFISEIQEMTVFYETKVNNLLSSGTEPISFTFVSPIDGKLGEIVYSLNHGLILRPAIGVTILSFLLSIFIDVIPILFAVLLLNRKESYGDSDTKSGGQSLNIFN